MLFMMSALSCEIQRLNVNVGLLEGRIKSMEARLNGIVGCGSGVAPSQMKTPLFTSREELAAVEKYPQNLVSLLIFQYK